MLGRHLLGIISSLVGLSILLSPLAAPSHGQVSCSDTSLDPVEFVSTVDVTMSITVDDGEGEASETVAHCARRCRRSEDCLSFTYSNQTCLLHPYDSRTGPEFKHAATNTLYYESLDENTDRTNYFSGCLTNYKNKCQNGGSCRTDCSAQGYYCACPENYRGASCEFAREDEPVLVQTIEGAGSRGTAGFSFNNEHILVIGGYQGTENGSSVEATSRVFKYSETTDSYEYDHDLTGLSQVRQLTPMPIGDQMFLFAANYQEFDGSRTTDSVVFVYSNGTFEPHQTVTTYGTRGAAFLASTTGQHYMFITNHRESSYDLNSPLYKWYSQYDKFYFVQNVATQGAGPPVLFDIAGASYLVVPFYRGDSSGYDAQPELWKRSDSSFIYMGCYLDSSNPRAMTYEFSSDTLDVETCTTHCRLRGYPYAGMQFGSQCYCSDEDYDIHGVRSDGECGSTCGGNSGQYCGASYRNSVYMTEPSWSKTQTLPDAKATLAAAHFHHEGADYLVVAEFRDDSTCDRNLVVYVWNGETEEFETHQTITDTHCVMEVEVFKANGRAFLITGATKTQLSVSDDSDYTVTNYIYIMEGTAFVPYWSLEGRSTFDWDVVERSGEIYLVQANYRNPSDGSRYDGVEINIYQWY